MTLRSPADSTKNPVIILCHGFGGIREILLPDFSEAFTRAGFSTITFDYRDFGDSDGERGRLVPDGEEIVTGKMNDAEKEAFLLTLNKMTEKHR